MTNTQTLIATLLSGYTEQYTLPQEAQSTIEQIRDRLVSSADLLKDAEKLYAARDCHEVALGLMWVIERSALDEGRTDPTDEEMSVIHDALTSTLSKLGLLPHEEDEPALVAAADKQDTSDAGDRMPHEMPAEEPAYAFDEPAVHASESDPQPAMSDEGSGEEPPTAQEAVVAEPISEESADEYSAGEAASSEPAEVPAGGSTDPAEIGKTLENLLEALQAGEETREELLGSLRSSFGALRAEGTADPSLAQYAEVVDDFLGYVQENDLLDDVRVMNFFTNVQEPFSQWLEMPEDERAGILEQAIEFLSDFRAMFE